MTGRLPTRAGFRSLLPGLLPMLLPIVLVLLLTTAGGAQVGTPSGSAGPATEGAPESTFFSTAAEESYSTYQLPGDGDLWPSCWADDGNLYTANGDGVAFTHAKHLFDMAVSRIRGVPPALVGETIATDAGANWSGLHYNRKPTGMLCIHGDIYLAFQNLVMDTFTDAPAASIARSSDHGVTWKWDAASPMFGSPGNPGSPLAYKFTTLFFLDYGRDSAHAIDGYVYAYGLDNNWRSQQDLYLARVPANAIQTRAKWEFYKGIHRNGKPMWSRDITGKTPVLTDSRMLYPGVSGKTCSDHPLATDHHAVSQGGVVYDAPLRRYLFASWSCATQEFYEAPQPWGPWRHFLSKDFGPLRNSRNYGQYGTNIPSKFISADGKTLYLQSNVWVDAYTFALRKMYLEPYVAAAPANERSGEDLAAAPGTRAVSKSTRWGSLCGLDCSDQLSSGPVNGSEDDFDMEAKTTDWWGYVWPRAYRMNRVVYRTGTIEQGGGWYAGNLRVQVRQNFKWVDADGVAVTPAYPYSAAAGAHTVYTVTFRDTWGDGVRIIGTPGGTSHFTGISRLGIFYDGGGAGARSGANTPQIRP